ncbi:MAG: ComF family protein [Crocinitomicaceae bacterium]|nr:ComF family protein [Crocinitomicaceae bacterium]
MIKNQLQIITSATLDIFYPNHCEICGVDLNLNENHLCLSCLYDLPYLYNIKEQQKSLNQLFWGRADVANTYSLFNYQKGNQVQDILHLIKYKSKTKMAEFFGEKLGESIQKYEPIDYILPVPLHPKKLRKRGFNQSTLIAKGMERVMNVKVNEKILKRVQHNPSQTTVTKYDRWENVRSIFEVRKSKKIEGKHVLVVDDVLTTGATIEACLKQLLQVDGCKVSVATLAARV